MNDYITDVKIKLKQVKIMNPYLFEPFVSKKNNQNQTPKYQATFLIEKGSPIIDEINEKIESLAKEKNINIKAQKSLLNDGDENDANNKQRPEIYKNTLFLYARNNFKPSVLDQEKNYIKNNSKFLEGDFLEHGDIVNAIITLYHRDNEFGKGISINLVTVQLDKKTDTPVFLREDYYNDFEIIEREGAIDETLNDFDVVKH